MKKLIVLLAVLASGSFVDASGGTGKSRTPSAATSSVDTPTGAVMDALRRACTSSAREAAQNWCDLAFSQ